MFSAHHRPPQALFFIRHKAEGQFLRHQSLYESFRIGEVFLAPLWPAVRLRLCQMQCSRHRGCAFSLLAARLPITTVSYTYSPLIVPVLPTPVSSTARSIP